MSFIKISIPGSRENSEPEKNPRNMSVQFPAKCEIRAAICYLVVKGKAPVVICKEVKTANEG